MRVQMHTHCAHSASSHGRWEPAFFWVPTQAWMHVCLCMQSSSGQMTDCPYAWGGGELAATSHTATCHPPHLSPQGFTPSESCTSYLLSLLFSSVHLVFVFPLVLETRLVCCAVWLVTASGGDDRLLFHAEICPSWVSKRGKMLSILINQFLWQGNKSFYIFLSSCAWRLWEPF